MIKVIIKSTSEVKEVTPNVAHGLIDSGEAKLYIEKKPKKVDYSTRRQSASAKGKRGHLGGYSTRQMRTRE